MAENLVRLSLYPDGEDVYVRPSQVVSVRPDPYTGGIVLVMLSCGATYTVSGDPTELVAGLGLG